VAAGSSAAREEEQRRPTFSWAGPIQGAAVWQEAQRIRRFGDLFLFGKLSRIYSA
jgi:hypothetical protein